MWSVRLCNAYNILMQTAQSEDVKVDIPFGEYAQPIFESQVETYGESKSWMWR